MLTLARWGRRLLVVNKPESMNQASDNWAVYHPNQPLFCKWLCGMGRPVFVLIWINYVVYIWEEKPVGFHLNVN